MRSLRDSLAILSRTVAESSQADSSRRGRLGFALVRLEDGVSCQFLQGFEVVFPRDIGNCLRGTGGEFIEKLVSSLNTCDKFLSKT
jgi:hypothetical protein